jgi:hypothetical protein
MVTCLSAVFCHIPLNTGGDTYICLGSGTLCALDLMGGRGVHLCLYMFVCTRCSTISIKLECVRKQNKHRTEGSTCSPKI